MAARRSGGTPLVVAENRRPHCTRVNEVLGRRVLVGLHDEVDLQGPAVDHLEAHPDRRLVRGRAGSVRPRVGEAVVISKINLEIEFFRKC